MLRTSIDKIRENGFELTKKRSWRYTAKTITDADYANDIAILANTPNQAETLLHSLERAAAGISLHVNAHKTEYICFNQTGDISTREGTSLKLVDKCTYLGSSVSSTEKDIDTRLTKTWTAIDKLSIMQKSDLTDKMKPSLFQAAVMSILLYGCTTWTLTKRLEKKQLHKNIASNIEQVLAATSHKAPTIRPPASHHENYPSLTKQTRRTLLEKKGRAHKWCTPMDPPHIAGQRQDGQLEHTYSSFVRIRDVALKICQRRWTIGRSGERGSGISVLAARHDDEDISTLSAGAVEYVDYTSANG